MLVHGVKGGLGPKLQGSHGTGQHSQHCQHHPQDADDAGEWGDHTIGGGGGGVTWPRDWYIYTYTYASSRGYAYLGLPVSPCKTLTVTAKVVINVFAFYWFIAHPSYKGHTLPNTREGPALMFTPD